MATDNAQGRSLLPLVLAVGFALYCLIPRGAAPSPAPRPVGPDLVAAFATNGERSEAREHAHVFATICASLADCLEYDGTRPEPIIKNGVQIDDLRRGLRQTRMKGWSFVAKYPDLGPAVDAYLTAEVGTSGGPLTGEQRAKWISALRRLAESSEFAARQG